MQDSAQAWPAQSSFPYLRHLLYTRAFSLRAPLSFLTHFSLPHISLQHRFLLQHPCQFLFIYFRLRLKFEFLSLWPHARNAPRLKNRNKCSFYKLQLCELRSFTTTAGFQNNHILSCHGGVRHSVRVPSICCRRVQARASRYLYGWVNKSIHHYHHHSTARHAKCAAHAECAERGRAASTVSMMTLRHWGLLQKVHIEECGV